MELFIFSTNAKKKTPVRVRAIHCIQLDLKRHNEYIFSKQNTVCPGGKGLKIQLCKIKYKHINFNPERVLNVRFR